MLRILFRKLIQGVLMVLIVSAVSFGLLASAGGDALTALRENPQVSEKTINDLRRNFGLDRPLPERYVTWVLGAATGDLGESISFGSPVFDLVVDKLTKSAMLGGAALIFAAAIAFSLGTGSVFFRSRLLHSISEVFVLVSVSLPRILLSLLVLALVAFAGGTVFQFGTGSILLFLLSAAALGIPLSGIFLAQLKAGLGSAMQAEFVVQARAKGLSEWSILFRHALRPALNPLITLLGLSVGSLMAGSVIVESVLGWPGIGSLMVSAVRARDIPLVMGIVLVTSVAVWFGNFVAEFLLLANDARIRSTDI